MMLLMGYASLAEVRGLHFTRGYIWMPLYLMGAQVLLSLLKRLLCRPLRLAHVVCGLAIISLFLLDNVVWFGSFLVRQDQGFRLTYDQKQLFSWMERPDGGKYLVVAQDPSIGYMAGVYTPLRA
jgi:hypothetical protein